MDVDCEMFFRKTRKRTQYCGKTAADTLRFWMVSAINYSIEGWVTDMYILGIGGSNHDFSSCITRDGEVVISIEDERITRKKHGTGLGVSLSQGFSRNYCLKELGLSQEDIELVVANDIINPVILFRLSDVKLINHHMAHAASGFYCSPFSESAILIVDAVGSKEQVGGQTLYESVSYAYGTDNRIDMLQKNIGANLRGTDYIENSLGIFYSIVTEIIGFGEFQEGKTMGLAPYGKDSAYHELKKFIRYTGNGKIEMTEKDIIGLTALQDEVSAIRGDELRFSRQADLAWAAQQILEDIILQLGEYIQGLTKAKYLCIAGGVALNSVANYKLYKSGLFEDVFIQPAAGDNGTAIGAALYGHYVLKGNKRF